MNESKHILRNSEKENSVGICTCITLRSLTLIFSGIQLKIQTGICSGFFSMNWSRKLCLNPIRNSCIITLIDSEGIPSEVPARVHTNIFSEFPPKIPPRIPEYIKNEFLKEISR